MFLNCFINFPGTVPLGAIKELPADSCSEIKASEGNEMVNGKFWIYSDGNSEGIEAYCEGNFFNLIDIVIDHHSTSLVCN